MLIKKVPVWPLFLIIDYVMYECVCVCALYPPQLSETSEGFLEFVCVMHQFRQEGWILMGGSRSGF